MKPTFLGHNRPLLTAMLQVETPEVAIAQIRNAVYDGADAFGFQIEKLKPEFRNEETYKTVFSYMEDRPIYITNYRHSHNVNLTDDERADGLMLALKSGATLCDVMGDFYSPSPLELTRNAAAIEKQKKLIETIHQRKGEVLMSSHVLKFLKAEDVLSIAKEHEARGADISKIVTASNTEEEMLENLTATALLKKELKIPFLFLSVGRHCKMHRMIGPMLGSVMYLCVQAHDALSTKEQPVLKSVKSVVDNFDWKPYREI